MYVIKYKRRFLHWEVQAFEKVWIDWGQTHVLHPFYNNNSTKPFDTVKKTLTRRGARRWAEDRIYTNILYKNKIEVKEING